MFIYTKRRIINADCIEELRLTETKTGYGIRVTMKSGIDFTIADFDNEADGEEALNHLFWDIIHNTSTVIEGGGLI